MLHNSIFIVKAVIRTIAGAAVNKSVCFVLVEIDKADIVFKIFIVNIVYAGFTVGHINHLHIIGKSLRKLYSEPVGIT